MLFQVGGDAQALNSIATSLLEIPFNSPSYLIQQRHFQCRLINSIFAKLLENKREEVTTKYIDKTLDQLTPGLFEKFVQVVETGEPLEQEFCWETDTEKKLYDLIAVKLGDGFSITVSEK